MLHLTSGAVSQPSMSRNVYYCHNVYKCLCNSTQLLSTPSWNMIHQDSNYSVWEVSGCYSSSFPPVWRVLIPLYSLTLQACSGWPRHINTLTWWWRCMESYCSSSWEEHERLNCISSQSIQQLLRYFSLNKVEDQLIRTHRIYSVIMKSLVWKQRGNLLFLGLTSASVLFSVIKGCYVTFDDISEKS